MSTVRRTPVTEALKQLLSTATNRPVQVTHAPLDPATGERASYPYIVIYPIPGGSLSGPPFCGQVQDATFVYQITVFGQRDDQVDTVLDDVRAIITERQDGSYVHDMPVAGMKVTLRDSVGSTGRLDRDGQIFRSEEDFNISVTSS